MPLTLDCYQPEDGNINACEVTGLKFKIIVQGPGVQAATLTLESATLGPFTYNALVAGDHDLTADMATWIDEWDSITCTFSIESTLDLGRNALPSAFWSVTPMFVIERTCANDGTMQDFFVASTDLDRDQCFDDVDGLVGIEVDALGSVFSGTVYKSRSLNSCTSAGPVSMTNFQPDPRDVTKFEVISADGNFCLYASGGTAPYTYWIRTGSLACGLNLDYHTGCVTGTKSGGCKGSDEVTFVVQDSAGQSASVTCGFKENCLAEVFGNVAY